MNARAVIGGVIAVLVALNLVQGAALLRLTAHKPEMPAALTAKHIESLPAASQPAMKISLNQPRPMLAERLKDARTARHELARYIASPNYNRAEAERRFEDLRAKNNAAQAVAEDMLLDAADKLRPEDRKEILAAVDEK